MAALRLRLRGGGSSSTRPPARQRPHQQAQRRAFSPACVAWRRSDAAPAPAEDAPATALSRALLAAAAAGALALSPLSAPPPALATDTVKVGTCLLKKCQLQLAQCLGDAKCLQNIVCLNTCNSAEDEAGCQIRCGDLYGDQAVDTFNACAVSDQKCVPQRADDGRYPVPPDCALDAGFDLGAFTGRWYITAGQNELFDTFDCQEHFFAVPSPGKLAAKINWRINKPNGDFIERSTIQTFVQDGAKPAVLYNHGNEYLHYQDDWYILASKPDSYAVVYYKGSNDAWDGYGGAVVYTRARALPPELVPELTAAVEQVGLKWSDFKLTDNTCKPHPPPKSLIETIEGEAVQLERGIAKEAAVLEGDVEGGLRSFGKGFTVLERRLEALEGTLERELSAEEAALAREAAAELRTAQKLLDKVEREVAAEERKLSGDLGGVLQRLLGLFKQ
ncbi:VDE1 [Scenedesmus sp. PABB004]|nr:VDE1 [Scenedesmus sp. PABB004]